MASLRHLIPLSRSLARHATSSGVTNNLVKATACRCFSTVVPGVGKGKTSTGLVSTDRPTPSNRLSVCPHHSSTNSRSFFTFQ